MQTKRASALASAVLACLFSVCAEASGVHWHFDGAKMRVTADRTLAGKALLLLWDSADRGDDPAAWPNRTVFGAATADGGAWTLDLAALGIANGTQCRIAAATAYRRLEMLKMPGNDTWVNTGIKDSDVYGVRFGFYPTSSGTTWAYCMGTGESGGFTVGMQNNVLTKCLACYRGSKFPEAERPTVSGERINHYAFTNTVFTVDGTAYKTGLAANAAVGKTGLDMCLGTAYSTQNGTSTATRYLRGMWSYVQFDGQDGSLSLDYVPVKRVSDGKVGFWDRATKTFVTSSGSKDFEAGTELDAYEAGDDAEMLDAMTPNRALETQCHGGALSFTVPSGLAGERLILAWDAEDMGEDLDDWRGGRATIVECATAGQSVTVRPGRLGCRSGNAVRVFAATVYKPLETLAATGAGQYVTTGIRDSDTHGVRFGFKNTASPDVNGFRNAIGNGKQSSEGIEGLGWTVGVVNREGVNRVFLSVGGKEYKTIDNTAAYKDAVMDFALTNGVFTIDGDYHVTKPIVTSPVGNICDYADRNNRIGTWNSPTARYQAGEWKYVQFDDASGNLILDYVPVRQVVAADGALGKAGFYDRATKTFVPSNGNAEFPAAGNEPAEGVGEVAAVNAVSAPMKVVLPGFMVIFK